MRDVSRAFAEAKLLAEVATERAQHELLPVHGAGASSLERPHYMLRVVPNREIAVEQKLRDHGVNVYLPKEKETRKTGFNRRQLRTVAVFYGTMFVPDVEADLRRLKGIADGIIGYQRFGDQAICVRPKFMAQIRAFEAKLDVPPSQRKRAFAIGQQVAVVDGPFAMFLGNISSLDSQHRLTVLMNVFGRMVPIHLDEDQVEAV